MSSDEEDVEALGKDVEKFNRGLGRLVGTSSGASDPALIRELRSEMEELLTRLERVIDHHAALLGEELLDDD